MSEPPSADMIQQTMGALDRARRTTQDGIEYWLAREIQPILGYAKWQDFQHAIERAKAAYAQGGNGPSDHFMDIHKQIRVGKGASGTQADIVLSRYACYLIAMNGDPRKPEIAAAQAYFTIQTRRMEVQDATMAELAEDIRRIALRDKVSEGNKALNEAAHKAGVQRFGAFHDAGYRGLYGMGLADLKAFKHIHPSDDLLDVASFDELAANAFRISQATQKIQREEISGERHAIDAHEEVGRIVRDAIKQAGGTMPEHLLPEAPIKELKRRVKQRLGTTTKLAKPKK